MEAKTILEINFDDVAGPDKERIKSALEVSQRSIISQQFKQPELKSILGSEFFKKAWSGMTSKMVSTYWEEVLNDTSPVALLESALKLPPNKKLIGFHLNGKDWQVKSSEAIEKIPESDGVILKESQLRSIYVAVGGDKERANEMFKSSSVDQKT